MTEVELKIKSNHSTIWDCWCLARISKITIFNMQRKKSYQRGSGSVGVYRPQILTAKTVSEVLGKFKFAEFLKNVLRWNSGKNYILTLERTAYCYTHLRHPKIFFYDNLFHQQRYINQLIWIKMIFRLLLLCWEARNLVVNKKVEFSYFLAHQKSPKILYIL